jgi:hypothetical protein
MSLSATYSGLADRSPVREALPLLLIVWLATLAAQLIAAGAKPDFSTDDAMRLVEIRDLLAGQSWFDLTQYRLNPPSGVAMHWSRLIDLPLALLIRAGEMVLSPTAAERVATMVWPAALLLVFLAGVMQLARTLGGKPAAGLALIFAALSAPMLQHFRPGAIDHHNAQLALLVWSLALCCRAPTRPRDLALAGALSAVSLAIGLELAPAVAALAAAVALRWMLEGPSAKATTVAFALAFALTTAALFLATVPPSHYALPACDMLSIAQLTAAGTGGIGLVALASVPRLTAPWARLAGGGALALALAVMLYVAFPACLGDPFADLDPRFSTLWLANVTEVRSFASVLRDLPQEMPAYYGLPAAALVLGVAGALRDEARWRWVAALAVLAVLLAMSIWLVRAAAAANAVAVALVPAALARLWPVPPLAHLRDGQKSGAFGLSRAALIAALLINPLALIAIGAAVTRAVAAVTGVHPPAIASDGPGTCHQAADYAPLARLPSRRMLAFIDAGPFLLMETPHTVLAAPYHRNGQGNAAMFDVFLGAASEAARRIADLGIDYIAFCPGGAERYIYARAAPDGLAAALARGEAPGGLERIPLDGTDLAVYRARH